MNIFGWIALIALACFGVFWIAMFAVPYIVSECKTLSFKIKRAIEDKRLDVQKRSEARQHRDELKREKDFELANKRLDAKLLKVDKQIKLQTQKLELAKQLKETTTIQKAELNKTTVTKVVEQPKEEKVETIEENLYAVPEEIDK